MENKDELEVFKGLGADEIDKKNKEYSNTNSELLKMFDLNGDGVVTQEEIDEAKLILEKVIEDDKRYVKQSYLIAYNNLDKDIQNQISKEDIENLLNGKSVNNEAIQKLQEKRQLLLEEEDKNLFKQLNNAIGGEMSENAKVWKQIKRSILVGLIFGIPGALFIGVKDIVDKNTVMEAMKEGSIALAKDNNNDKFEEAIGVCNKYFGGIVDVPKLIDNIKSSDILTNIKDNEEAVKGIISEKKDIKKEIDSLMEDLEKEELLRQEEIEEQEKIELEMEEDPEPVEGMKFI